MRKASFVCSRLVHCTVYVEVPAEREAVGGNFVFVEIQGACVWVLGVSVLDSSKLRVMLIFVLIKENI